MSSLSSPLRPSAASAAAAASPSSSSVAAASSFTPEQLESTVYDRFMQFSGFGDRTKAGEISDMLLMKMCRECNILSKGCTRTDIDLFFTRCKAKNGNRKLNYTQFTQVLLLMGEKRFPKTFKEAGKEAAQTKVMELIANSAGPQATATKPDNVKWHDDRSTYTGVYAQGGPTNTDNIITLSNLLDRSPSDARGRKFA